MAEAQRGVAVFWGIGSSFVMSGTGVVTTGAVLNPQSIDHGVDSQKAEVGNYRGETVAKVYYNEVETMSVRVIPTADTIAHVKGASVMPHPGAVITVVDTDDTAAAGSAAANNQWLFESGKKTRNNTQPLEMQWELYRNVSNDLGDVPS